MVRGTFTRLLLAVIWINLASQLPIQAANEREDKLLVVTIASNATDGYRRFQRSAEIYGYQVQELGMHESWLGDDMCLTGGGYKINLMKQFMKNRRDDTSTIYLFTDSNDVIFTAPAKTVREKFLAMKTNILFAADRYCWPDWSLADQYPPIDNSSAYLNSRGINLTGFIGFAKSIYELLTSKVGKTEDDDQQFCTKSYLDSQLRNDLGISLDHKNDIFQELHGSEADVKVRFTDDDAYVINLQHNTEPAVLYGNGPSQNSLNQMGNYLAKSWTSKEGCLACNENVYQLKDLPKLPIVVLALFIEKPTPFLPRFLESILLQDYPKDHIHVFIHNNEVYHEEAVNTFLEQKNEYASVIIKGPQDGLSEADARSSGINECSNHKCDYYFSVDSEAVLTEPNTLSHLLQLNRTVLAPMLSRPGKLWGNFFWGAVNGEEFDLNLEEYKELLNYTRRGIWNVPFFSTAYLIRSDVLQNTEFPNFDAFTIDGQNNWCAQLRRQGFFMYMTNVHYYGHLINADTYNITLTNPEFYQQAENKLDWENRYIHKDYFSMKLPETKIVEPCPDVYWFPVVTPTFCKEVIEIMENFGQWSNGRNEDQRLESGYENVPTRDIHMDQVGLEEQWLLFLNDYIHPIQWKLYPGYFRNPLEAVMNFVVRYRPDEQPALRPHHDLSTYTINLALNAPQVDYQGGGCRFVRYNCSVTDTRLGWTLIHPGRLTHFHEGLPVTNGTRYIMISFIDP